MRAETPKNGPRQEMRAQAAADERPGGDAETQRGLVQDDRLADRAPRGADDGGEGGGDEQGVAQPPDGPEPDDAADGVLSCRPGPRR